MRADLEVLNSSDLTIITITSGRGSECMSKAEEQMPNPKCRTAHDTERIREHDSISVSIF